MQERRRSRRLAAVSAGFLLFAALVVAQDVWTPERVAWLRAELPDGGEADAAPGLVLQEQHGSEVWASMGYSLYRSRGGEPFERIYTVRPPLGEPWGGYSRWLRDRFGYQELVEAVPLASDRIVVFAGGAIFVVDPSTGSQRETLRLRYFGRGQGRGVMPHGIAVDDAGSIYFGEYPTGPSEPDRSIRLYRSDDRGETWQVAFEFVPPLTIRHIHGVQWDPLGRLLWVTTGDADGESRVGFSSDRGRSFTWIASGAQEFRVCSLLFFHNAVVWVPDAVRTDNHVHRWRRVGGPPDVMDARVPGPAFYAQRSAEREGVVGLAELAAEAWEVAEDGSARRLAHWSMSPEASGRPHPGVRLARGSGEDAGWVLLNPLRVDAFSSAIYRLPRKPQSTPAP